MCNLLSDWLSIASILVFTKETLWMLWCAELIEYAFNFPIWQLSKLMLSMSPLIECGTISSKSTWKSNCRDNTVIKRDCHWFDSIQFDFENDSHYKILVSLWDWVPGSAANLAPKSIVQCFGSAHDLYSWHP